MNSDKMNRCLRAVYAAMLAISAIAASLTAEAIHTSAADVRRFDLGGNAQSGWTSVSASDGYNKSKGYGFGGSGVKNVGASGKNELSDAVQFTDWTTTFNVDLPKGLYRVKVTLGNTSRTSVYMENILHTLSHMITLSIRRSYATQKAMYLK